MNTRSVLVIDDDDDIREMITLALVLEGCEVQNAADCDSALSIIQRSGMPEVIFLDYCMPGMCPRSFVRELAKLGSSIPRIVLMTAVDRAAELARKVGTTEVLTKPFSLDTLYSYLAPCMA